MSFFHAIINQGSGGTPGTTPTQQAYSLTVSTKAETTETLVWSRGNGSGILVVGRASGAVNTDPTDGNSYLGNSVFGSGSQIGTGNYVVYNGTGTTVAVTGLTAGTTYHFEIYEYNGSGSGIKYRTLGEKGRSWTTLSNIPHEVVDAAVDPDGAIIICGSTKISYSTDQGSNWTQWADLAGEAFHSMFIATGGTIHNASGNPVTRKYFFNSHSGTAKVYASYTRGGATETVLTGAGSQTWNTGAWNPNTSRACIGADSGVSRIAILENGRTVSYASSTLEAESIASICSTPGASDGTEFLACFKNASEPGKALAKMVSGSWSKKNSPVGKVFHMIKWIESLGIAGASSADGTGNDFIYSDDLFETYDSANVTGAFGDWCWDDTYGIAFMVSRTPGEDYQISFDLATWYPVTNPDGSAVWFNVEPVGDIFMSFATSGTTKGAKTTPSNITNAKTWPSLYLDWMTVVQGAGVALPSSAVQLKGRAFIGTIDAVEGLLAKIKTMYIIWQDGGGTTFKYDLKNPGTAGRLLVETGTNTFVSNSGWSGNGTNGFLNTQFIPSTEYSATTNCGMFWDIVTDQEATVFEIGVTGDGGTSSRILVNTHATDDTVGTVAFISANAASNANATSVHFWALFRNAVGAIMYRDNAVFDSSLAAVGSRPNRPIYLGAHNNVGTAASFNTRRFAIFGTCEYLTEAEYLVIYNAWQTYKS
jgi:hypothetical protein